VKTIDAFMADTEDALVEFRINYLRQQVDKVYVCEGSHTFSGFPKTPKFHFFEKTNSSVEHVIIQIPKEILDAKDRWQVENYQREEFLRVVSVNHPMDLILFSDVDEIPSTEQVEELKTFIRHDPSRILQIETPPFLLYANWLDSCPHSWGRGAAFLGKNAVNGIRHKASVLKIAVSSSSGGHLSYMGVTRNSLAEKYSRFSHAEFDNEFSSSPHIFKLAKDYQVSFIGNFHEEGRGLLKVRRLSELSELHKALHGATPKLFRFGKTHHSILSRLIVSKIITDYVRLQSQNVDLALVMTGRARPLKYVSYYIRIIPEIFSALRDEKQNNVG